MALKQYREGVVFDTETKGFRIDKAAWPRGEWDDEPDRLEWRDAATGLPCLVVRNHSGALCGYVGVGPTHPWSGIQYNGCSKGHKPIAAKKRLSHLRAQRERAKSRSERDMWIGLIRMEQRRPMPEWKCKCHSVERLLDVHGGLTYSNSCNEAGPICHTPAAGEPAAVWWFGFDCAHLGDVVPVCDGFVPDIHETYKNLAYVKGEVKELATQLAAVEGASERKNTKGA